ncbi:MAG: HlyD family secretion protein [Methyloligellaceae bacterium]
MTTNRLRVLLLAIVPVLVLAAGLWFWLMGGRYISTENAFVKTDLVRIATEVSGRVIELGVREHQHIEAGAVLLRLDPKPFKIALAKAEADLALAERDVRMLVASWQEAQSQLTEAESNANYFRQRAARQMKLADRGVISDSRKDEIENDAKTANSRLLAARKRLTRASAALNGNPSWPVPEHPLVKAARAERARAALDLARTEIRAPEAGTVVNLKLQPGEHINAATPIFAIVSAKRPWIEANFKEADLTHVAVGQKATVVFDIFPDIVWDAIVESISPATGAEFAILPPQNASGNWVKVVQRLPVRLRLLRRPGEPPLRIGTSASVKVDTERRRRLSDFFISRAARAGDQRK